MLLTPFTASASTIEKKQKPEHSVNVHVVTSVVAIGYLCVMRSQVCLSRGGARTARIVSDLLIGIGPPMTCPRVMPVFAVVLASPL